MMHHSVANNIRESLGPLNMEVQVGQRGAVENGLIPEVMALGEEHQTLAQLQRSWRNNYPNFFPSYAWVCCQHLFWDEFTLCTEDKALWIRSTKAGLLRLDQLEKVCGKEKSQHPHL